MSTTPCTGCCCVRVRAGFRLRKPPAQAPAPLWTRPTHAGRRTGPAGQEFGYSRPSVVAAAERGRQGEGRGKHVRRVHCFGGEDTRSGVGLGGSGSPYLQLERGW